MTRVFSGIKPSGTLHLGSYLGALRQWSEDQRELDCLFCVVDLHSLTVEYDPGELARRTLETAAGFIAAGIDPELSTIFVQSHVPAHSELAWLVDCVVSFGELSRMTQFKDRADKQTGSKGALLRAGLFNYPALMAADILLYDTERVPVGDDQRQHLELTRDVAIRFNNRYGETFVVPEAVVPRTAARVMDLTRPDQKMSKSEDSPQGTVDLTDSPEKVIQKIRRAVTDTDGEVRYDRENKPGLSNLIEILAASTGRSIQAVVDSYTQYGPLKADCAEAVVELLRPVRERYEVVMADAGELSSLLETGAARAGSIASKTMRRARDAMGLLPAT